MSLAAVEASGGYGFGVRFGQPQRSFTLRHEVRVTLFECLAWFAYGESGKIFQWLELESRPAYD